MLPCLLVSSLIARRDGALVSIHRLRNFGSIDSTRPTKTRLVAATSLQVENRAHWHADRRCGAAKSTKAPPSIILQHARSLIRPLFNYKFEMSVHVPSTSGKS